MYLLVGQKVAWWACLAWCLQTWHMVWEIHSEMAPCFKETSPQPTFLPKLPGLGSLLLTLNGWNGPSPAGTS